MESGTSKSTGYAELRREGLGAEFFKHAFGEPRHLHPGLERAHHSGVTFLLFERFSYHLIGDRHHRIEYTRTSSMRMNGSGERHLRPWSAACSAPLTGIAGGALHSCAHFLFLSCLHGCTALVPPDQEGAA